MKDEYKFILVLGTIIAFLLFLISTIYYLDTTVSPQYMRVTIDCVIAQDEIAWGLYKQMFNDNSRHEIKGLYTTVHEDGSKHCEYVRTQSLLQEMSK